MIYSSNIFCLWEFRNCKNCLFKSSHSIEKHFYPQTKRCSCVLVEMLISQKCDNTKLQFWLLQTSLIDDEVEALQFVSDVSDKIRIFYKKYLSHIMCRMLVPFCSFASFRFSFCHICIKYHFSSRWWCDSKVASEKERERERIVGI